MKQLKKKHKQRLLIIIGVVTLLIVSVVIRPALLLYHTISNEVSLSTKPIAGFVNDASSLNQTKVAQVWDVPVSSADPEGQLRELLGQARGRKLSVSIAGARHSMGGHTISPGGIFINMLPWKKMSLDESKNILTVQAGAVWSDIIAYLDQHTRSVAVMQSNNSFSVGGSVSVNCHGWQFNQAPIASTVESFRLMQADGNVIRCSRAENPELFSLVLGGYGLFGIILDVNLRVVPNERYKLDQFIVPINSALTTFDTEVKNQPDLQMLFARMNIVPGQLFQDVIINVFHRDSSGGIPALHESGGATLRRALFRGSAESDYGKALRWSAETRLQPYLIGKFFSRNQLLNESVTVLENHSADSTDILQEYFVPRREVADFVEDIKNIIPAHAANLLNVTIRSVNEDPDTFLRYANEPMFSFVMLFVQNKTAEGERKMELLTQALIETALNHEGRYYLPYRLHASTEQFDRAYPKARQFFELKRKYDPSELFQNEFYLKYGRSNKSSGNSAPVNNLQ